ncbi:hypothetical protein CLU81_2442 [Flavobacterium sp. 9]|uniref:hypothetical protein n=1 Tax=Flavobacterium sp. 9 TaxID=2035198 RepID=UPI000C628111|nr:hypothetical protein [Flavobacterium sp. 9]PIF31932.1 hypothetical protein CLU81_2442 [Flavobacterium sp. 9]
MKETIRKSLILSLLITNIWSVITFFIYFYESGLFHGLTTLMFFVYSCWFSAGLGILVILLSFIKRIKIKFRIFSLTLVAWMNFFFFALLFITMALEIIRSEAFFEMSLSIVISIISLLLIRKISKQFNNQPNE